jgi:hypothetical protein
MEALRDFSPAKNRRQAMGFFRSASQDTDNKDNKDEGCMGILSRVLSADFARAGVVNA